MTTKIDDDPLSLPRLFPFLVAFDRSLGIVEVGAVWERICPGVRPGERLDSLFRLVRPSAPLTWESCTERESTVVLLECIPIGLTLRGQMTEGRDGVMRMLGFPWVSSVTELTPLKLTLSDFPGHVATPDMLFLLQAKDSALKDTTRLATEIAQQRAAIRLSEQRVRSILDSAMDAVVSIDASGVITEWNPQSERLFGWTAAEAVGRTLADTIMPAAMRSLHAQAMEHFLDTGELRTIGRRVEVPALDRQGREIPVELSVTASGEGEHLKFHAFVRDIRERMAAERELRESRERLNLAVDGGGLAIWDWNVDSDELVVNDRWFTMLGYRPREIPSTGKAWAGLLHPEDREHAVSQLAAHLKGETESWQGEFRLRAKDDEWRWLQPHGRVVSRDASGRALRVTGVQHDITRRKRSELALAAQLALTSVLSEAADTESAITRSLDALVTILDWEVAVLWTVDADGKTLSCRSVRERDRATVEAFVRETNGLRLRHGIGLPGRVWQYRHPQWASDLADEPGFVRLSTATRCGLACGVALPLKVAGSVSGVLEVFGRERRRRDADTEHLLLGLASQLGQFLERRRSEEALKQSQVRMRRILDTAMDAVITIDAQGCVVDWNSRATSMFGFDAADVVGRPLSDTIVPPSLRADHQRGLANYLRTGTGKSIHRRVEVSALHRDGREFPVELSISPLQQDNEQQFAAFLRDITDRRRAERELSLAKEAAEVANEAKTRFLATMSHEIRTPLNPILGMASLLLDGDPTPEQRKLLERIRHSGMLLLKQINEILDFSRIEAGRIDLDEVAFDPREILTNIVDIFAVEAREKGLELATRASGEIPAAAIGDPGRLQQVIANLVSNAIKFTETGGVLVMLASEAGEDGRTVLVIRVHDTGIGIPARTLESIFQPFTQTDASTNRRFGGSGLGLAIARELARQMGGDITVFSDQAGSTFEMRVPVRPCDRLLLPLPAPAPAAMVQPHARILVAEDNAANQEVVVMMLQRLGHTVDVAADGDEAISAFRSFPYDLVLMDCQMPGTDGFEATRIIRSIEAQRTGTDDTTPARTRVVAMTALAVAGDRERCLEAGMDDYLSKPVQFDQLARMIQRNLCGTPATEETIEAAPSPAMTQPEAVSARFPADPAIDPKPIADLRAFEKPERPFVNQLIATFLEKTPSAVSGILAGQAAGDLDVVAQVVHDLKSESGMLGATRLSTLSGRIQKAARSGDATEVREAVATLRFEADRACGELRRILGAGDETVDELRDAG